LIAPSLGGEPVLIAHRGLQRYAPENTMPALAACVELSLGFELDVYSSRDDQLVVIHDGSLRRTTNGPDRSVREFTVAELKRFDAGSWFHPAFKGLTIPTLDEVLTMVSRAKRGTTSIALDIKQITPEGERQLVSLVAKHGLLSESFAFDQSNACSRRLKAQNQAFRIAQNVGRKDLNERLAADDLDVLLLTFVPTPAEMSLLHQKKKVALFNFAGPGTARCNPAIWDQVKAVGCDGMLTDFPLECRLHWREQQ
jgi:glycerophosphoryl diester phosphodiesterase